MSNFWDLLWLMFSAFMFVAYLFVMFQVVADLFRDSELGGFSKALWIIGLILLPFLFPLAWMLLSSLKTQVQNTAYPPVWVFTPTLNNYREVFLKNPFFTFTLNSLIVAAGSTGLALVLGLPGAYAVARFKQTGIALAILQGDFDRHPRPATAQTDFVKAGVQPFG